MPTAKPRIAVTLNPYVHETVKRLAELQGRSRGAVVADLLEAVHPPLMRTVALMEAARDAPEQVKQGLRGTIQEMERELQGSVGDGIRQMDYLLSDVEVGSGEREQTELPRRRSGGGSSKGANPRPGNTGVRSSGARIPPSKKGK